MRKVKFQEGGNVRGPSRDLSEWTDQELSAAIRAEEIAQTPYMERPVTPRTNFGLRSRVSPPTGAYSLADLRNERRRRQPASRRYAPFEGEPGGEVAEEETRPAPRASTPANMPRYNQGPSAAEAIDRAANRARTPPPPPAPSRGATAEMETADVPGNRATTPSGPAAAARMREIDMQGADVPGNRGMSPAPRPRPAARPAAAAPAARPRPRMSEADRLNQMELDRIEQERIDADRRGLAEAARRRREVTPERGAPGTGNFFKDLGNFARAITGQSVEYRKGGKVKKYQEGGRVRQGIQSPRAQEARAEMAEDVMKRARKGMGEGPPRRVPNSMLTPEEQRERNAPLSKDELDRMRGDAYKKGGMIKPKGHGMKEEAMEMKGGRYRGGAKEERAEMMMKKGGKVATKKMKSGGKVAPKKMMKGGIVAKPKAKKMMGGGRAMYAKGGMARGCK